MAAITEHSNDSIYDLFDAIVRDHPSLLDDYDSPVDKWSELKSLASEYNLQAREAARFMTMMM